MSEKKLNRENAMTVTCAAILVGTEIIAAALALGWAVGGLMDWGREFTIALVLACFAGGIYLTYVFVRNALRAEPFYE